MTSLPVLAQFIDFDARISSVLNRWSLRKPVCGFFRVISHMGDGPLWYATIIGMGILGTRNQQVLALHMAIIGIFNTLLYKGIKVRLKRPRPFARHTDIVAYAKPLDEFSFPSGHTMHAVAFGVLLTQGFPALFPLLLVFMLLTGLSRITLGLHYISDVLMGALLGLVSVALWMMVLSAT